MIIIIILHGQKEFLSSSQNLHSLLTYRRKCIGLLGMHLYRITFQRASVSQAKLLVRVTDLLRKFLQRYFL